MVDDPRAAIKHFRNHKPRRNNACTMCEMEWPCAAAVASRHLTLYLGDPDTQVTVHDLMSGSPVNILREFVVSWEQFGGHAIIRWSDNKLVCEETVEELNCLLN